MTEVLVVVAIVFLVFGLFLSAIQHVRAAADRLACSSNLRQIAVAIHHYHQDYHHVPRPRFRLENWQREPNALLSTLTHLTPYVEAGDIFTKGVQDCLTGARPHLNPPHTGLTRILKPFICPTDGRLTVPLTDADGVTAAYGSYLACRGGDWPGNGIFGGFPPRGGLPFSSVTDGLSNTILYGERPPPDSLHAGRWYPYQGNNFGKYGTSVGPDDSLSLVSVVIEGDVCSNTYGHYRAGKTSDACDRYHFWSLHPGGSNFAFGDCSVHFIPYSIDERVLSALGSRAGGEAVSLDDE